MLSVTPMGNAVADVIKGELSFTKKPAKAAVFYELKSVFNPVDGEINQANKAFTEKVGVASHNAQLVLKNNDDLEHNVFANDMTQNVQFDVGLMAPGSHKNLKAQWKENTLVRIGCKIHPKMRSYVANIPSDNFVSFEFKNKEKVSLFELKEVTGNAYVLLIAGMDTINVMIEKGESKEIDIMRKGKKKGQLKLSRS